MHQEKWGGVEGRRVFVRKKSLSKREGGMEKASGNENDLKKLYLFTYLLTYLINRKWLKQHICIDTHPENWQCKSQVLIRRLVSSEVTPGLPSLPSHGPL